MLNHLRRQQSCVVQYQSYSDLPKAALSTARPVAPISQYCRFHIMILQAGNADLKICYSEPITPNTAGNEGTNAVWQEPKRQDIIAMKLKALEKERKLDLEGFRAATGAIKDSIDRLERLHHLHNPDAYEQHRAMIEKDMAEMEEMKEEFGKSYKYLGYEIEEMYADLAVG